MRDWVNFVPVYLKLEPAEKATDMNNFSSNALSLAYI